MGRERKEREEGRENKGRIEIKSKGKKRQSKVKGR
jgi:hypothetical protein